MSNHGSFSGNPKTEWLVDESGSDRSMRLLEDFWYLDPDGRRWPAPRGSVVDGGRCWRFCSGLRADCLRGPPSRPPGSRLACPHPGCLETISVRLGPFDRTDHRSMTQFSDTEDFGYG